MNVLVSLQSVSFFGVSGILFQLIYGFVFVLFSTCFIFVVRTAILNFRLYYSGVHRIPCLLPKYGLFQNILFGDPVRAAELINSVDGSKGSLFSMKGIFYANEVIAASSRSVREVSGSKCECFEKSKDFANFLDSFTGESSIFSTSGQAHMKLRTMMSSTISSDKLINEYSNIFIENGVEFSDNLYAKQTEQGEDIVKICRYSTFKVIMDICFGWNFIGKNRYEKLFYLYNSSFQSMEGIGTLALLVAKIYIPFLPTEKVLIYERHRANLRNDVEKLCLNLIQSKMYQDKSTLSFLLDEKNKLNITSKQLTTFVLSLLMAGQATTTLCIPWMIYICAKYPKIQQKLYEEFRSIDQKQNLISELQTLSYLNNVIKECIRLYPPLLYTTRTCIKKEGVHIQGELIPFGATVRVPILAMGTNERIWGNDALQFIPERFERDDHESNQEKKWFSAAFWFGPYSCIGGEFANVEIKVFLYHLLLKYEVSSSQRDLENVHRFGTDGAPRGLKVKFLKRT